MLDYISGFLWKDKSDDGIRKVLEEKIIPLDKLSMIFNHLMNYVHSYLFAFLPLSVIETDAPYCFPNTRAKQIPATIKKALTERSLTYLNRYW